MEDKHELRAGTDLWGTMGLQDTPSPGAARREVPAHALSQSPSRTTARSPSPSRNPSREPGTPSSLGSRRRPRQTDAVKEEPVRQAVQESFLFFWFSGASLARATVDSVEDALQGGGKPAPVKSKNKPVGNNKKRKGGRDKQGEPSPTAGAGVKDFLDEDEEAFDFDEHLQSEVVGTAVEDVMRQRWPVFTICQSLIVLLLWFITALNDRGWDSLLSAVGGLDLVFPGHTTLVVHADCNDLRSEVWRWWTYQFTHAKFSHVANNVFLFIVAGIPVEGFEGTRKIILMFSVGVLGAAAVHGVSDPHAGSSAFDEGSSTVGLVGMSGGCYALLGVHMGNVIMNFMQMRYRWPILISLLLLIALDILLVQLDRAGGSVDHSAHLGGYLAGLLTDICIGRNLVWSRKERLLRIVCFLAAVGLTAFCLAWWAQWPPRSVHDSVAWCMARQVNNVTVFGDRDFHCIRCQDQACMDKWAQQRYINRVDHNVCSDQGLWEVTER